VVKWTTIRPLMVLRQLDFVLANTQAEVEGNIYMKPPKRFKLKHGRNGQTHVPKLLKSDMD